MRNSTWFAAGLAGLLLTVIPSDAVAQRRGGTPALRYPAFTIEAYTGFSTFSRFIEQDILRNGNTLPPIGERSLHANVAYVLGGALGAWVWDGTAIRLGYTWATSEFKYRDSSGLDRDLLDSGDLNKLNSHIISLEVIQLLFGRAVVSPYLVAGINGEFWVLGDQRQNDAIFTTTGSQFRWGGSAGLGLQIRASRPLAFRLEADAFRLGSPFRGKSAFIPEAGLTFDKPDNINMPRYTLGLIYTFLRRR